MHEGSSTADYMTIMLCVDMYFGSSAHWLVTSGCGVRVVTRPSVPSQKCRNSNVAGPSLVWPSTSSGRRRSEDRNAEAPWPAPAGWSPPARQHGPRWQQAPTLHSILLYVVYTEPRYCRKLKYFSCIILGFIENI